jgi:acyl-CoA thioester hydrolase
MRSDFRLWITVPTRFRDMDVMGHVNSSVYFTYFESARTEFFAKSGVSALRVPGKWGIPVVSQTCHYRDQVTHPDTLEVGVRCSELREKTVHLVYEIYRAGSDKLVADGSSISVWVDLEVPKSVSLPEEVRRAIRSLDS